MKKLLLALLLLGGALPCFAQGNVTGVKADQLNVWTVDPTCRKVGQTWFSTTSNGVKVCPNSLVAAVVGANLPALSDNGTNVTSTEAFLAPAGTTALPPYSFSAGSANGMMMSANQVGLIASNGALGWWQVNPNVGGVSTGSTTTIGWNSATTIFGGAIDAGFRRRNTASMFLGIAADVNGVPVAQTLGVQNAITGANLVGSIFTLDGSLGTGVGLPAPVSITGADQSVATGTTAQTGIHRLVVGDTKNLTTGAATTVLSIPLATLQMAGATITYHMEATDGTNQCTRDGVMTFSAENSAGVFVTNLTNSAGANDSTACTATKTLTEAWAVTSANPALVQVTPTLTGITATRFSLNYTVMYGGNTQPTL